MQAGFAREDITPPLGTFLLGTGAAQARPCDRVNDPIYVRALSVEHAGEAALIVGLDVCFLGRPESDRLKGVLARELELLPRQVLINASHTHSAPAVSSYYDMRLAPPLHDYLHQLEAALVRAARSATETRRPVEVLAGMARTSVPMNRRQPRDGTIVNAPNPGGPVLDSLPLCLLREPGGGAPVCLIFAVSTHPVCMRDASVSADYPGVAMRRLDEHLAGGAGGSSTAPCSLFLQGAGGGNSRPAALSLGRDWNFRSDFTDATRVGEAVASEVIAGLQHLRPVTPRVASAMIEARFPFAPLPRGEYEKVLAESAEASLPDSAKTTTTAPPGGPRATRLSPVTLHHAVRRDWAARNLALLDRGDLPAEFPMLVQGIQLGEGLRLIALESEPMAEHGRTMEAAFAERGRLLEPSPAGRGQGERVEPHMRNTAPSASPPSPHPSPKGRGGSEVTFALGYSNGDGIYLVTSPMLDEGGYEAESFWEYGHPAPLAKGIEPILAEGLASLHTMGVR